MGDRFESILQARATAREQARGNRGRAVSDGNGNGARAGTLNGAAAAVSDGNAAPAVDAAGDAADPYGYDAAWRDYLEQQRIGRGAPESALSTGLRKLGADALGSARRLDADGLTRADALLWYDLTPAERRALQYARAESQALNRAGWALLTPAERTAYRARRDGAGDDAA